MEDITEASEEVLWTAGFAVVTAAPLFALLAGVTWAATMLGPGSAPSRHPDRRLTSGRAAATLSIVLRQ